MKKSVRVQVPATSANLGPGFDVLGLSLGLYNDVFFTVDGGFTKSRAFESLSVETQGNGTVPLDESNLVLQAAFTLFAQAKKWPRRLEAQMVNRIPLSRGLGSSSAAIVGGLFAANAVVGEPFDEREWLRMAVAIEGHPDNVVPAAVGGLCVSAMVDGKPHYVKFAPPRGLSAVICVPETPLSTSEARRILPAQVPFKDAVFTSSRVALLISALIQKRFDLLGFAMDDVLHQPARAPLLPGMMDAIQAAKKAGAYGAALSGSGSTMIAFTKPGLGRRVGTAMQKIFASRAMASAWRELAFENRGVRML